MSYFTRQLPGCSTASARLHASLLIVVCLLVVQVTAVAQVLYGSLTGNVTDSAGAAVPNAKVEALNVSTNVAKQTTANDNGVFIFSDLQPGVYQVTITAPSFQTMVQKEVRVEANTVRRLDTRLQVGAVNEAVEVAATVAELQTDRADINVSVSEREINNLPLTGSLGRNYQSLLTLVPGAVNAGEQNSAAGNPQRSISFNVNGVSRLQNNTRIDGSSVVYPWLPTNTAYVPPAEGIEEVNIVTNSFDAEQGLAGGAAINLAVKSGTNEFHGAGWVYDTNSATQARNYFQTTPQVPKNILVQYGYSVGGPILKNKLFFFTDFERTTQRNFARVQTYSLAPGTLRPDAQGNVTFPTVASGGATIYDPASNSNPAQRTPFANNVIPASRIDLAALELIKRLPLPTGQGFSNNFTPTGVAEFNRNNIDGKVNYNSGGKLTLFGRYSISPTLIFDPPILEEAVGDALNGGQLGEAPGRVQLAGFGGTYTFKPNLLLDANVGYTRQRLGAEGPDIGTNFGLEVLKIPGTNGTDRLQSGVPFFAVSGWANMGNSNTGNPFLFRDNQYVGSVNLSWLKVTHSLRFGFDYQNQQLNHFQPQGGTFQTARGSFQFNGNSTRLQNGPTPADTRFNAWADFLLGLPSAAGKVDQLRNPNALRMKTYALYARDHWQINPQFTISYGLRWERYPFPTRDHTGVSRFDPDTGQVVTGGLTGVPEDTGASSGHGQFLPRFGIAYRFGETFAKNTVIRAGYGMSADPRPFIDFRNSYPIVNAYAMPQIGGNAFIPVTTLRQGIINSAAVPDLSQGILPLPANTGTTTYPKEPMRKYIQSWNFTIERELPWNFIGQIGYVGTRAVGQMGFININASAPGTGTAGRPLFMRFGLTQDINDILPYMTTTYDALQTQFTRRFRASVLGLIYTYSKAINFADNDANPRIQYYPEARRNRGPAGYDRTHNFQSYGVYDLPFGKNQRWLTEGVASWIFGGFQVNGVLSLTSGAPFYVIQGNAGNLNALGSAQVPDQIKNEVFTFSNTLKGTPPTGVDPTFYRYFDTTAYAPVNIPAGQPQRFGNAGRNNIRGPGFFNIDLGLFRSIFFTEDIALQFRIEALNALNHPNFSNPASDISNAGTFGYITSTTGQGSRIFRGAIRVSF